MKGLLIVIAMWLLISSCKQPEYLIVTQISLSKDGTANYLCQNQGRHVMFNDAPSKFGIGDTIYSVLEKKSFSETK